MPLWNLVSLLRFASIHDFILMAMEVHNAPDMIWIVSLGNVLIFFMIDDYEVNYLDLFAFNFSTNNVLVLLLNLAFVIEKKIALV
jgi:hypothetical protein